MPDIQLRQDTDIRLCWLNFPWPRGEWELDGQGGLVTGNDLVTSVLVSLFSNRLALTSDRLPLGGPGQAPDRQGWHGDTWLDRQHAGDKLGSRLWLLPGSVTTDKTPILARSYAEEALAWLIEDGVASRVDCDAFFVNGRRDRLGIVIDIYRPGLATPISLRFDWVWSNFNPCEAVEGQVSAGSVTVALASDDLAFVLTDDDGGTVLTP